MPIPLKPNTHGVWFKVKWSGEMPQHILEYFLVFNIFVFSAAEFKDREIGKRFLTTKLCRRHAAILYQKVLKTAQLSIHQNRDVCQNY